MLESLIDAMLKDGVTDAKTAKLNDRIHFLEAENRRLRDVLILRGRTIVELVNKNSDLGRRLSKAKFHIIELQIQAR